MANALLTAFSFMLLIVLGYVMREHKLLPENAGEVLKIVLFDLTLPCAIVTTFASLESFDSQILVLVFLGFLLSVIMVAFAAIETRNKDLPRGAFDITNMSSFNIGAFCLPFVQSFLPAIASVSVCAFDIGNSVLCAGGTYVFAKYYLSQKKSRANIATFVRSLLLSPPLMTYVVMLILAAVGLRIPRVIVTFIEPASNANAFIAMMMVGSMMHFEFRRSYVMDIVRVIIARHIFALIMAPVLFFCLPLDLIVRQALVLACFAPIPALATPFTGMLGGDEGKSGAANSISIVCSILEYIGLIAVMGLY